VVENSFRSIPKIIHSKDLIKKSYAEVIGKSTDVEFALGTINPVPLSKTFQNIEELIKKCVGLQQKLLMNVHK